MATYLDGSVRKATPNTVTAMRRSAESRRCPACGRKSALVRARGEFFTVTYCRWSEEGKCSNDVDQALADMLDYHLTRPAEYQDSTTIRRIRYEIAFR